SDISNSLHNASDHLPVSVNIIFSKEKIYRDVLNFETNKLDETILIYPNPSKTKININSKFLLINSIQIYDNFGRIILSNKINSNITEIDISNLLLGNYWIRINFNFGSKNFKIIKN
ncbi:MAG: T9SS type A sorting domain-containing protein, partial [Bacteroidota bacterium]|nr:T9SS type A sorting domain-containing protein [Bacteroidota bacterium]